MRSEWLVVAVAGMLAGCAAERSDASVTIAPRTAGAVTPAPGTLVPTAADADASATICAIDPSSCDPAAKHACAAKSSCSGKASCAGHP